MKVLYVRVSTVEQNLDRQLLGTDEFDEVVTDKCSGGIEFFERNGGKRIFELLETGRLTELVVHSIDRLGRNLVDVLNTINLFTDKLVNVKIRNLGLSTLLTNNKVNPTTNLIVSIMGSVSEMERTFIRERQREGIEIGKLKGSYSGRKKGTTESTFQFLNKPKSKKIKDYLDKGYSVREVSVLVDCSTSTVMKVKKLIYE